MRRSNLRGGDLSSREKCAWVALLTPFFFGDSASHLLGVLHEPALATSKSHGVVLCPPVAQEHVRTHWALRQVAVSLAKAGFHCLRFDWFGVGDSAGQLTDASIERWTYDAVAAVNELRDVGGVGKVSLMGLRLGATIAALAAKRAAPTTLVLWDPVLDGGDYIDELRGLHDDVLGDPSRFWEASPRGKSHTELVGFELGATLVDQIRAIDSAALADLPQAKVRILCSSAGQRVAAFERRLHDTGFDVAVSHTALRVSWSARHSVEELLLAADAATALTRLVGEGCPS